MNTLAVLPHELPDRTMVRRIRVHTIERAPHADTQVATDVLVVDSAPRVDIRIMERARDGGYLPTRRGILLTAAQARVEAAVMPYPIAGR